jgi:hypothetical protein
MFRRYCRLCACPTQSVLALFSVQSRMKIHGLGAVSEQSWAAVTAARALLCNSPSFHVDSNASTRCTQTLRSKVSGPCTNPPCPVCSLTLDTHQYLRGRQPSSISCGVGGPRPQTAIPIERPTEKCVWRENEDQSVGMKVIVVWVWVPQALRRAHTGEHK